MLRHVIEVLRGQRLQKTCTKHMVCFELRNWRLYAWVETDNSQLQNPFEGMKATGLGTSADAYTAEKPWLVVLLLGKMRNRSLSQIEFLDPYYSPYIYIYVYSQEDFFFSIVLFICFIRCGHLGRFLGASRTSKVVLISKLSTRAFELAERMLRQMNRS